jgi:hypothetical protein
VKILFAQFWRSYKQAVNAGNGGKLDNKAERIHQLKKVEKLCTRFLYLPASGSRQQNKGVKTEQLKDNVI